MRVLVAEPEPGTASAVADALRANGHTVRTCSADPRCPLPGRGSCPLIDGSFDFAIVVRNEPTPFAPSEQPALCAVLNDHAPHICSPFPDDGWLEAVLRRAARTSASSARSHTGNE
jgi:hypothetical protein